MIKGNISKNPHKSTILLITIKKRFVSQNIFDKIKEYM